MHTFFLVYWWHFSISYILDIIIMAPKVSIIELQHMNIKIIKHKH